MAVRDNLFANDKPARLPSTTSRPQPAMVPEQTEGGQAPRQFRRVRLWEDADSAPGTDGAERASVSGEKLTSVSATDGAERASVSGEKLTSVSATDGAERASVSGEKLTSVSATDGQNGRRFLVRN